MGFWKNLRGAVLGSEAAPPLPPPPRPGPDARAAEDMPGAWTVESFVLERGMGVLRREGERVAFDAVVWRSENGAPEPGKEVHVVWKRSRLGTHNVPAEIMLPSAAVPERCFTVTEWLRGMSTVAGVLRGVTTKKILAAMEDEQLDLPWLSLDPKGSFPTSRLMDLLEGLATTIPVHHPAWGGPRPWLHAYTWYDDGMDESLVEVAALVGLDAVPARRWGVNDFEPFLLDLEREAAAKGRRERLYVVDRVADGVVVSFEPEVFERLTAEGLLLAHAPKAE